MRLRRTGTAVAVLSSTLVAALAAIAPAESYAASFVTTGGAPSLRVTV